MTVTRFLRVTFSRVKKRSLLPALITGGVEPPSRSPGWRWEAGDGRTEALSRPRPPHTSRSRQRGQVSQDDDSDKLHDMLASLFFLQI